MPLANIEKFFVANLLQPEGNETEFLSALLPVGSLSEKKQLSIYRSNINGACQKVLGQVYPACKNILGEDYFNQLCRTYRFEHPSIDPDLNNYGALFSAFIKEQVEVQDELSDFEYLSELACLEWRWHASYYVKNDEPFSFEKFALVDVDEQNKLFFKLSCSFSLYSTLYPLLEIWAANKSNVDEKQEFSMLNQEGCFCISRVGFTPEIGLLDKQEYRLLKSISNGMSLTQLIELNEEHIDGFQCQIVRFIEKGWISGFLLSN